MLTDDYLTLRSVRLAGAEKWEPGGSGRRFVFIRSGTGVFTISSASLRLTQGDILVFSVGISSSIRNAASSKLIFSSFSVHLEYLLPLFSVCDVSRLQNFMGKFKSFKFYAAGSAMAADCHRVIENTPPESSLDHRVQLLRIVALVFGEEFKSLQSERSDFASMEQQLLQGFEKFSADDILSLSTNELSAKYGCSRRHLSRLFKKHFGFSVATLRMELRMLRAVSLLRNAQVKVKQVAERCGFSHYAVFIKFFKRRFGISPGHWRTLNLSRSPATVIAPQMAGHSDCLLQSYGMCPMVQAPAPGTISGRAGEFKELPTQPDPQSMPLAGAHKPVSRPDFNAYI